MENIVNFIEKNFASILYFGGEYKFIFLIIPFIYNLYKFYKSYNNNQYSICFNAPTDEFLHYYDNVWPYYKIAKYMRDSYPYIFSNMIIDNCQTKKKKTIIIYSFGDNNVSFRWDNCNVKIRTSVKTNSNGKTEKQIIISVANKDRDKLNKLVYRLMSEDDDKLKYYSFKNDKFISTFLPKKIPKNHYTEKDIDLWEDIATFFNNRNIYERFGIPFKRGYLLDGIPGSGKTSCIFAIANNYKMNVYELNINEDIKKQIALIPRKSIISINDFDRINLDEKNKEKNKEKKIDVQDKTKSILEVFDGYTMDGTLLILTTNNKEKLDPAIIRSGRVDRTYAFGYASVELISRIMKDFFGKSISKKQKAKLINLKITTSELLNRYLLPFSYLTTNDTDKLIDEMLLNCKN